MSRIYSRGQTLIEYGLLLALIAIIVIVALIFLGPIVKGLVGYPPITIDEETYIYVYEEQDIMIDGELYVRTNIECLNLDGDTIDIEGIDYVAVGEDQIEFEGRTYVSAGVDCLSDREIEVLR